MGVLTLDWTLALTFLESDNNDDDCMGNGSGSSWFVIVVVEEEELLALDAEGEELLEVKSFLLGEFPMVIALLYSRVGLVSNLRGTLGRSRRLSKWPSLQ